MNATNQGAKGYQETLLVDTLDRVRRERDLYQSSHIKRMREALDSIPPVTREEALKMFTIWPAYASFREADLGTIEIGKIADFTGFNGDLLTMPEEKIPTVEPAITVVGGKVVWKRS